MGYRTVLDTNNWVSYFIVEKHDEIVAMTEKGVVFLHSKPSVAELREVLSRKKFQKYNFDVERLLYFYTQISEFVKTTPQFTDCPDPKDNFLFDLAIQGKANFLVSGDKKVLETPLKNESIQVRSLTAFKAEL